jgi:hypothetical protein
MADIAIAFHWTPDVMDAFGVHELMEWRERARVRIEPPEKK